MRRKKVWRYYCDFCKKAGCSGGHIKKHESRCTLNPNRSCGMCKLLDENEPNLTTAMSILPNPKDYEKEEEHGFVYYDDLEVKVERVMQELRDFVSNCPACIMAALRQKGIPVPLVKSFNFSAECKSVWNEFNEDQRDYGIY